MSILEYLRWTHDIHVHAAMYNVQTIPDSKTMNTISGKTFYKLKYCIKMCGWHHTNTALER